MPREGDECAAYRDCAENRRDAPAANELKLHQSTLLKSNLTKRRFKAPKRSSCALCKPHKRGWDYKKTPGEMRRAMKHAQELREQGFIG
jgi:hypothetical protein